MSWILLEHAGAFGAPINSMVLSNETVSRTAEALYLAFSPWGLVIRSLAGAFGVAASIVLVAL
ncbi:MAG: hypothetical protein ACYDEP_01555 [Acidimicrobiales bacterium]